MTTYGWVESDQVYWTKSKITAFLGIPLFVIRAGDDFPSPDHITTDCECYRPGEACERICSTCEVPLWKPDTVKAWAEAKGLSFDGPPKKRYL
jgi:hypothetical protein